MALPVYTVTATVDSTPLVWNANYAVQTGSLPPVHAAYVQQTPVAAIQNFSYANGSATMQATKIVAATGNLTTGTAAASVLDLVLALDIGGTAAGLTHLRELWIFNDGTSPFSTAGAEYLLWDLSVANSWGIGTGAAGFVETGTTPVIKIQNGSYIRIAKPFGTAGWVVDATHKLICLGTPTEATTYYRIVALGDSA